MKRITAYIVLCLGALSVSCVESRVVPENESSGLPILFAPSAETKAVVNDTQELNVLGNKLTVYDRYTIGAQTVTYINGMEYTYGAEGWKSTPTVFWTKDGVHDFTVYNSFLVSQTSGSGTGTGTVAGMNSPRVVYNRQTRDLTISNWTLSPRSQFDFLYAHATRDLSMPNPYAPVMLQMKHLLSAVRFNVTDLINKSGDRYSSTYIRIKKLEVKSFRDIASNISIPFTGEPRIVLESHNAVEIPVPDVTNVELEYAVPHNIYAGKTYGTDGSVLFFPHAREFFKDVTALLYYDEITYRKSPVTGWYEVATPKTKEVKLVSQGTVRNWESGKRYIYNFYIHDDNIAFDVKVVPWIVDDVILDE